MVERKWVGHLISAAAGGFLIVLVIGWLGSLNDQIIARDCEAMGMVMLKDKPYRCEPMEDPRNG